MEKKHKRYLKANLISLFFVGVSFISITLAWFAYSGLITAKTEINVKAWYIEFAKNGTAVSNNIVISLKDISPGMQTMSEKIDIKNLGDSPAEISYEVTSARILDETLTETEQEALKDKLSHDYPFHVDMSLSNSYAHANDGTSEFEIAVSWPLDSDNDEADSEWGSKAYKFNEAEAEKKEAYESYVVHPSLKIEIALKAVQYIDESDAIDYNYKLGDIVLYNVQENKKCSEISSTCLKTYVIDKNNKLSDSSVTLLPDLYNTYTTSPAATYADTLTTLTKNWTVTTRGLTAKDILPVISKDIINSVLVRPNISNEAIGYLDYGTRLRDEITKTISYEGYYRFLNEKFPYFSTSKCYWLNTTYNENYQFALQKIDDVYSKVYNETKTTECSIVPVIEVAKKNLQ